MASKLIHNLEFRTSGSFYVIDVSFIELTSPKNPQFDSLISFLGCPEPKISRFGKPEVDFGRYLGYLTSGQDFDLQTAIFVFRGVENPKKTLFAKCYMICFLHDLEVSFRKIRLVYMGDFCFLKIFPKN